MVSILREIETPESSFSSFLSYKTQMCDAALGAFTKSNTFVMPLFVIYNLAASRSFYTLWSDAYQAGAVHIQASE